MRLGDPANPSGTAEILGVGSDGKVAVGGAGGLVVGASGVLVPAGQGLDTSTAGALTIGANTATSVTILRAGQATTIAGSLVVAGAASLQSTLIVSSTLTISAGGLTITAGGLTITAGGAAITGASTVTGPLTIAGAGNNLLVPAGQGLDTSVAGALVVGATNANAITIGRAAVTATVAGPLTVSGAATLSGTLAVTGTTTLGGGTAVTSLLHAATVALAVPAILAGATAAVAVAAPAAFQPLVATDKIFSASQNALAGVGAITIESIQPGPTNTITFRIYANAAVTAANVNVNLLLIR